MTLQSDWQQELETAMRASREAAEVALAMQAGIAAEPKSDGSPVTAADRKCEAVVAAALHQAFPEDGLFGEEGTNAESRSGRRWIIDPIDGTRDYLRGNPLWANLIGLEANGEVVAGVVNLPVLGAMYVGTRGGGAFRNGVKLSASGIASLAESVVCLSGLNRIDMVPFREMLFARLHEFWAVRSLGGAPDAMLIAAGQAEFWVEPRVAPWDLAPLKIIIEESGGRFFSFEGRSTIYDGNCVGCAPEVEAEVRQLMGLATPL